MKFVETAIEKQMRLTSEWDALWKGNLSGHQFEALFEEAITELELAGLGKNQRELLLGHVQKVGPQWAAEIQKDIRTWTSADGEVAVRRVATWEEAHRILVGIEWSRAGDRALQSSYAFGSGEGYGKGRGKGSGSGSKGPPTASGSSPPACWDMRKAGMCSRGKDCEEAWA